MTDVSFSFKVTAKDVCAAVTFTLPDAQTGTSPALYKGRTQTLTFPAWTPSPSYCPFVYVIDGTSSGALGDAATLVTLNKAVDTRTVGINSADESSWTDDLLKEYTLPIQVKHPDDSGTLASETYNYKFQVMTDPCSSSSPTETLLEASRTATWAYTLLGDTNGEHVIDMNWNPSACDDIHKYSITWGTGSSGDATFDLNADGKLTYDSVNKKLIIDKTTTTDKAGTYTIYVAALTATDVAVPLGDDNENRQTITLTLTDPCVTAVATFVPVADVTYKLGDTAASFDIEGASFAPAACNAEIDFPSEYVVTIPTAIQAVMSFVNGPSNQRWSVFAADNETNK